MSEGGFLCSYSKTTNRMITRNKLLYCITIHFTCQTMCVIRYSELNEVMIEAMRKCSKLQISTKPSRTQFSKMSSTEKQNQQPSVWFFLVWHKRRTQKIKDPKNHNEKLFVESKIAKIISSDFSGNGWFSGW